jgi:hypothetical protein
MASGSDHPDTLIIRHQIAMERADEGIRGGPPKHSKNCSRTSPG